VIALPLATARLVVRRFTDADAEALAAYRSHPDVARFQN
jgi:RimJ/RimL family protein N-acetyltransferase